jgi:uncharacterized protein (TIGR02145 family)
MKNIVIVLLFILTSYKTYAQKEEFQTVKIGNQIWVSMNLDVDKFRNGDPIPQAQTDEEWLNAGENGQPAWCYYDNDPKNGKKYGKLYNWYAVNDYRGLAPVGYRIPTDADWELVEYKSGSGKKHLLYKELKKSDLKTKNSGFNAVFGGIRNYDGYFGETQGIGYWWSSTEFDEGSAFYFLLTHKGYYFHDCFPNGERLPIEEKRAGYYVRCIKD